MDGTAYMDRHGVSSGMAVSDIRFEEGRELYIYGTAVWFAVVALASLLLVLIGSMV